MKKRIAILLIAALFLTGCQEQGSKNIAEFESVTMPDMSTDEIAELMEMDINDFRIGMCDYGIIENKKVVVYSVLTDIEDVFRTPYIVISTESGASCYEVGNRSLAENEVYLCDIDGDASDEIIVQQTVAMSGGAGGFTSLIYQYENGELRELFASNLDEYRFDTGFSSRLKDGWKLEISNDFTEYMAVLDFSNTRAYQDWYFDENGNILEGKEESGMILADSFRKFVPEDTDGDGIYEISCLQYVSLASHADYIGDVKSILKYDKNTGKFQVTDAELIPYEGFLRQK